MTKKIHIIMVGPKPTFSDIEVENIESWKRNFPGWEFKIWRDEDCIGWIKESSFASCWFEKGVFAYVSDYLRLRILYEEGGLYMDTDVYSMNRIPDPCFGKSFMAWDVLGISTNNGTCLYASEPKLPIFKEFVDCMRNSSAEVSFKDGSMAANARIDSVLRKHGLRTDFEDYAEVDQDLGDIVIRNRSQFGVRHKDDDGYLTNGKEVYLVHACFGSWVVPSYHGGIRLKYAIIDKGTDLKRLEDRIRNLDSDCVLALCLVDVMDISGILEASERFKPFMRTFCIPCEKNSRKLALDFITKRIADIRSCNDLMREDYCG